MGRWGDGERIYLLLSIAHKLHLRLSAFICFHLRYISKVSIDWYLCRINTLVG
ncbi:MAG: hypothetical protein KME17_28340 [Cyanosarcina radialis HA8281-LM2]|nr:hypothetical protein [Cyanosarcina radialis HA8281-LM2]